MPKATTSKATSLIAALALAVLQIPAAASAEELTILAGDLPPMFNSDGSGREAEVITSVMERCGHSVTFEIQPFTRHWKTYAKGKGDGVATVPLGMPLDGHQSEAYIQYQNGVSSLAETGNTYADLSALSGQSVIAFMGASEIIPGLKEAVSSFKSYKEIADQIGQSRMIFGKRVDAVIGDGMIFAEYNRQLRAQAGDLMFDPNQDVTFQAVFAPSDYGMNFRSEALTADFNRCYGEAKADGSLDAINKKWADQYRATLGTQYLGH